MDVRHFLVLTLIMSQSMVEKIALPSDVRDSGRDPFEIADQI